ncbi:hypothetical protein SAMN04487910_3549 [Aquimarina amphilecti]|uniref:Uncharacterized protein n=1 Tax=Aquimarina amphilecti TaxID=1038014 RepID=A0A1H7TQ35_AQUAM|nr:hypothetical protein [Aquimarina amphilecti]SEL86980.1 hypothetical protein SAMN04487910_3549 [Aquimarina amphilecti]
MHNTYGDGTVIRGNIYEVIITETSKSKRCWFPLCDTVLKGIEKYEEDVWTEIDISYGAFEYDNQKFVFGPGAIGNEGYIASITLTGELNSSIFLLFKPYS